MSGTRRGGALLRSSSVAVLVARRFALVPLAAWPDPLALSRIVHDVLRH